MEPKYFFNLQKGSSGFVSDPNVKTILPDIFVFGRFNGLRRLISNNLTAHLTLKFSDRNNSKQHLKEHSNGQVMI